MLPRFRGRWAPPRWSWTAALPADMLMAALAPYQLAHAQRAGPAETRCKCRCSRRLQMHRCITLIENQCHQR